jgi:hypothetical protein
MKTLKTSEKSKTSPNSLHSQKSRQRNIILRGQIGQFSTGKSSTQYKTKLEDNIMNKRTVRTKSKKSKFEKNEFKFKNILKNRSKVKEARKSFKRKSKELLFAKNSSKSRGIFSNKKGIIKAFEIGRKTPNSKKKLSLDFIKKSKKLNSQQTRKHLSIYVDVDDDVSQINRNYFSTKNSNVMEFKPFTAGKSSILKLRESKNISGYDSKGRFSNFLNGEQPMNRFSESRTPTALFSKYLYKRKGKEIKKSPNFKKKKTKIEVMEVHRISDKDTPKIRSSSKASSRKLKSFFNKNNPRNKQEKLIASQKNYKIDSSSKNQMLKKNSLSNISKRLSNRKMKIHVDGAHESLNENSMLHIQNRVDIETLINSKLMSSRSKNTFLDKTNLSKKMGVNKNSETSIILGEKKEIKKEVTRVIDQMKKQKSGLLEKVKKARSKGSQKMKKNLMPEEPWNLYKKIQPKKNFPKSQQTPKNMKKVKITKKKYSKEKRRNSQIHKKMKAKKVILRKNSKVIISTRKSSKTPESKKKSYTRKRKKSKKIRSTKLINSMGKKSTSKGRINPNLFSQVRNKKQFYNTQIKNSKKFKEKLKSSSLQREKGLVANKIMLFKNIKEKLTTSFKKKQMKINLSSRISTVQSTEKSKSFRKKGSIKKKFKSYKKSKKLKLGSISPGNNLKSMRLRQYSKTPNAQTNMLKSMIKRWPQKRSKFKRSGTKGGIESVSCLEKSILDSRIRQRDPFVQMMSIYTPQNIKIGPDKLKIANLFSKHELQKKIQKTQKENFSKFNLSAQKSVQDSKSFVKKSKYKNLISIKFNLDPKNKKSLHRKSKSQKRRSSSKPKNKKLVRWFNKLKTSLKESKNIGCQYDENVMKIRNEQRHKMIKLKSYLKKKIFLARVNLKNINKKERKKKFISKKKRINQYIRKIKKKGLFIKGKEFHHN